MALNFDTKSLPVWTIALGWLLTGITCGDEYEIFAKLRPEQIWLLLAIFNSIVYVGRGTHRRDASSGIQTYSQITLSLICLSAIIVTLMTRATGFCSDVQPTPSYPALAAILYLRIEAAPKLLHRMPLSRLLPYPAIIGFTFALLFSYFSGTLSSTLYSEGLTMGVTEGSPLLLAIVSCVFTTIALTGWSLWWVKGDHGPIQDFLGAFITAQTIIPYAIFNAWREEIEIRNVLLGGLIDHSNADTQHLPFSLLYLLIANFLHSIYFAYLHYAAGFPSGFGGFVLVYIWSMFLGALRIWTGGMWLVFWLHVHADIVIFGLVVKRENELENAKLTKEKSYQTEKSN